MFLPVVRFSEWNAHRPIESAPWSTLLFTMSSLRMEITPPGLYSRIAGIGLEAICKCELLDVFPTAEYNLLRTLGFIVSRLGSTNVSMSA
jgi:hypothetical protein